MRDGDTLVPEADHPGAEIRETHLSTVLLAGDRAYKLLKRVEMPFLDLTDRETRLEAAVREVELNRRLAPDVYLGMADVRESGELVDHFIVMRRLPDDRRLSSLVAEPEFLDQLRAIARKVATFHAGLPPATTTHMASVDSIESNWVDNFAVIDRNLGTVIPEDDAARVSVLARAYLSGRGPLFEKRTADSMVRDGHGDLLADDIFCLDDGPRIIDCLAFNDNYRISDVLADVAFLAMDVERLAGRPPAASFLAWYREFTDEHHPESLAHHYIAYRAHVRAKVACLRHEQGHAPSAALARSYHQLCLAHLEEGRIRLVLVGGGPGVGKSVLAHGLADQLGWPVLSSDETRKTLAGVPIGEHRFAAPGEGLYDPETTERTYERQLDEAATLLSIGYSVILDASWSSDRHRAAARSTAGRCGAELVEIECVLDAAVAKDRISRRLSNPWNPSDATPDVVDHLASVRDPWPTAASIDTGQDPGSVVAAASHAVVGTFGPTHAVGFGLMVDE